MLTQFSGSYDGIVDWFSSIGEIVISGCFDYYLKYSSDVTAVNTKFSFVVDPIIKIAGKVDLIFFFRIQFHSKGNRQKVFGDTNQSDQTFRKY
jgi:hypothetical protein